MYISSFKSIDREKIQKRLIDKCFTPIQTVKHQQITNFIFLWNIIDGTLVNGHNFQIACKTKTFRPLYSHSLLIPIPQSEFVHCINKDQFKDPLSYARQEQSDKHYTSFLQIDKIRNNGNIGIKGFTM